MGGDDNCGTRFSDHGSTDDGKRQGANSARRKPRQTKDVMANRYHHFLSRSPAIAELALRD